jgi:hypothetical protein
MQAGHFFEFSRLDSSELQVPDLVNRKDSGPLRRCAAALSHLHCA